MQTVKAFCEQKNILGVAQMYLFYILNWSQKNVLNILHAMHESEK